MYRLSTSGVMQWKYNTGFAVPSSFNIIASSGLIIFGDGNGEFFN